MSEALEDKGLLAETIRGAAALPGATSVAYAG